MCCRRFGGNSGPFSSSAADVVWSLSSAKNLGVFDTQVKLALLRQGSLVMLSRDGNHQPLNFNQTTFLLFFSSSLSAQNTRICLITYNSYDGEGGKNLK